MLYFAYGSNMSMRRLAARIDRPKLFDIGLLKQHQLVFNKLSVDGSAKCSILFTQNLSHRTHGVVYEINDSSKQILDEIEGLGKGYAEKQVELITANGQLVVAHTYVATIFTRQHLPYQWYHHHVLTGALEAKLPQSHIDYINNFDSIVDPDRERHLREMKIYD